MTFTVLFQAASLPTVTPPAVLDPPRLLFYMVVVVGAICAAALFRALPSRPEALAVIFAAFAFGAIAPVTDLFGFHLLRLGEIGHFFANNRFPPGRLFFSTALGGVQIKLLGVIGEQQLVEVSGGSVLDEGKVSQGEVYWHLRGRLHKN